MARNIIIPPIAGDTCSICWGVGKSFGTSPTPSVVTAVFSDIELPPFLPPGDFFNLTLRLDQLPGLPCVWQGGAGDFVAAWSLQLAGSTVLLNFDLDRFFTSIDPGPCEKSFQGDLSLSLPNARGGTCQITF